MKDRTKSKIKRITNITSNRVMMIPITRPPVSALLIPSCCLLLISLGSVAKVVPTGGSVDTVVGTVVETVVLVSVCNEQSGAKGESSGVGQVASMP